MRTWILISGLFLAAHAWADSARLPESGEIFETDVPLALYGGTPDPSFGTKAAQIGHLPRSEHLVILETRQYPGVLGTEIWVEVEKESDPGVKGWIFAGVSGSRSKLLPVKVHAQEQPTESEVLLREIDQDN